MKTFVVCALFLIGAALAQDDTCRNDFRTFVQCLKDEFQAAGGVEELKPEYRSKINACFDTSGCARPDYDAEPFADAEFFKMIVDRIESYTPEQKKCIHEKMSERVREKIEKCLNEPIPEWAEEAWDEYRSENQMTEAKKEQLKQVTRARVNVMRAARQCNDKEALGKCLIDVRAEFVEKSCERRRTCAGRASDSCRQRANDLRDRICQCMEDAKEEWKSRDRSEDNDPMSIISSLRNRKGHWQEPLNECGIDTTAMAEEYKPKLQEFMMKKCEEAGITTRGRGRFAMLSCARQLRQRKSDEMQELFKTLKDYMKYDARRNGRFCRCSL